jgi:hypothetical protein
VYYRVYLKGGAVKPKNSISKKIGNDPSIGYIMALSIAPPHNVKSLKQSLCSHEGIEARHHVKLFLSASSFSPMGNSRQISILEDTGVGSKLDDPLALVVDSEEEDGIKELILVAGIISPEPRYGRSYDMSHFRCSDHLSLPVYYKTYNINGIIKTRNPFDPCNLEIARYNSVFVTPPSTVGNLKRAICHVEGINYQNTNLFIDLSSHAPANDEEQVSTVIGLKATREEPMAIVSPSLDPVPSTNLPRTPEDWGASELPTLDPTINRQSVIIHDDPTQYPILSRVAHSNGLQLYVVETREDMFHVEVNIQKFHTNTDIQPLATFNLNLLTMNTQLHCFCPHLESLDLNLTL